MPTKHYPDPHVFIIIVTQVLAGIAQQLTSLWNCVTDVESWLPVLLETMLLLTSHPSLTLAHTANSVWLAFLKHEQISKLPYVLAVVPRWLQASAPKVLKVNTDYQFFNQSYNYIIQAILLSPRGNFFTIV